MLGVAFTVLACTYLAIQYMLALKRTWFLIPIGVVAIAEPILLLNASTQAGRLRGRRARRSRRSARWSRSRSRCGRSGAKPAPAESAPGPSG